MIEYGKYDKPNHDCLVSDLCIWVAYGLKIKYYLSIILRISHKKIDLNVSTHYIIISSYQQQQLSTNFVIVNQNGRKNEVFKQQIKIGIQR